MSLYVTELRRLFKRRLTRVRLVLLVLGLGAIATAFAFSSHQLSPAVVAEAQAASDADFRQAVKEWERSVAECDAATQRNRPSPAAAVGPSPTSRIVLSTASNPGMEAAAGSACASTEAISFWANAPTKLS